MVESSATYPFIESLSKSFIIQARRNCFVKETVFWRERIRRLASWKV